jgi:NhaA family Na+:H+ antiporter
MISGAHPKRLLRPLGGFLGRFLATESAGAVLLVIGVLVALIWANSPWSASYADLWSRSAAVSIAHHGIDFDVRAWVNDGLMTLFFLVVGLEIKRELTSGHLARRRAAALPIVAALGGMAAPALVYLAIAGATAPRGWAIPMATDIALAVGILAAVGNRIPTSLRAFLLGLAIVDDIGAIVIIALVYSQGVSTAWLLAAIGALAVTRAVRGLGVRAIPLYVGLGGIAWFALHEAGVHPTLAGVAMGLLAPAGAGIERLERLLHPWTSYAIVPIFALANSGIEISADGLRAAFTSAITWAIIAGLVLGKPVGVLIATAAAVRSGAADAPADATRRQLVGVGAAAGIGYTVALFITDLAFADDARRTDAKLGILAGSLAAAAISYALLSYTGLAKRTGKVAMPRTNDE